MVSPYRKLIARNRTEKSLRTDNKRLIVLKNLSHNNRQSLICFGPRTKLLSVKLKKYEYDENEKR